MTQQSHCRHFATVYIFLCNEGWNENGQAFTKCVIAWGQEKQVDHLLHTNIRITWHLLYLGFRTGTGKPAVLPKRVPWVRVWFRFLAHRDTPRTRAAVSRVLVGLL